jgi:hypothetical protein
MESGSDLKAALGWLDKLERPGSLEERQSLLLVIQIPSLQVGTPLPHILEARRW